MKINKLNLLSILGTVSIVTACDIGPQPKPLGGDSNVSSTKMDLRSASAEVSKAAEMNASLDSGTTLRFPGFTIRLKNADYVQVLRCVSSYDFQSASGVKVRDEISKGKVTVDDAKSAWMLGFSSVTGSGCNVVGDKISRENFVDFSAGNRTSLQQSFYYVVNPCLSEEHVTDRSEFCSYNLKITNDMTYTAKHEADFITAAVELNKLESTLSALFGRLQFLAGDYGRALDICDYNYQKALEAEARKAGLNKLLNIGLGVAMNALFMGTGPVFMAMAGTIKNAAADAFLPKPQRVSYSCDEADALQATAKETENKLILAMQSVQAKRLEMAKIDASYAALEVSEKNENFGN